jgi:uncharacterized protein YbjT (DUF2867 family)
VALAGATGLVGRECLDLLLADPGVTRVNALVRRPLRDVPDDPKLVQKVIDFDHLQGHAECLEVDQVICALGTTMREAGSEDAFRKVDYEYPLRLARYGLSRGARHFLLVSAVGADPASRVFYSRVKGETERAISVLEFPSLTIVRPSLLLGEREESRLGEEIGKRIGWLTPRRFRPVHAHQVASALVRAAREDAPGRRIIENAELRREPDAR